LPHRQSATGIASWPAFDTNALMRLGRILIFPIKSLDGVQLDEVTITEGGILENDRIYAIFDEQGRVVNGKRTARVHALRCEFDPGFKEVRLWTDDQPVQFCLDAPSAIDSWLSEFFGFSVRLKHDPTDGFADDRNAFGPTVVSNASLRAVQEWFPEFSLESIRLRFRTNLELTEGKPFCEDQLYAGPEEVKAFRIGGVNLFGHNPCQRCVVPTRDPVSGEPITGFQKKFMEMRKQMLPEWAEVTRFNHYYRFAVNTSIPASEAGKKLRVGDPVIF
jgi:uncharacterized protein